MNFYLPIITFVLCGISFFLYWKDLQKNPIPIKKEAESNNADGDKRSSSVESVQQNELKTDAADTAGEKDTVGSIESDMPDNLPCISESKVMPEEKSDAENDTKVIKKEMKKSAYIPKSAWIYAALMICVTLGASFLFATLYNDNSMIANIKRLALLSLMWPIAYIDSKSYRIPNSFIILGLCYRVIIVVFELIFEKELIGMNLLSEGIAAAALLLASGLCALCIKHSIGFGDMKLFVVMGLLIGLEGIWSAIFLSLLVSFAVSVYMLASKKKTRKDAIPFGPALVIGTFLSICLRGV